MNRIVVTAAVLILASSSGFAQDLIGIRIEKPYSRPGVVVVEVSPGSPADRAGVRKDSRITHVNNRATLDMASFSHETNRLRPGDQVELTVMNEDFFLRNRRIGGHFLPTKLTMFYKQSIQMTLLGNNTKFVREPPKSDSKEALEEFDDVGGTIIKDRYWPSEPVVALQINAERVSDVSFKYIPALSELKILCIKNWGRSTRLKGTGLIELKALGNLKSLELPEAYLAPASAKQIAELTQLESIELDNAEVVRSAFRPLAAGMKLQALVLEGVSLSDEDIVSIGQMTTLKRLDLGRTKLNSAGLAHLKTLKNLTYLNLEEAKIGDADMVHLAGMTQLEFLDLSKTAVTDQALIHLGKMERMQVLCLNLTGADDASKTKAITVAGLETHLKHLTNLVELQVEGPDFEPSDVRRLGRLWPRTKIVTSQKTIDPFD